MKEYINFGWMEALAITFVVILTTGATYWKIQNGDPESVWFFCDKLGLCEAPE